MVITIIWDGRPSSRLARESSSIAPARVGPLQAHELPVEALALLSRAILAVMALQEPHPKAPSRIATKGKHPPNPPAHPPTHRYGTYIASPHMQTGELSPELGSDVAHDLCRAPLPLREEPESDAEPADVRWRAWPRVNLHGPRRVEAMGLSR